MSVLAEISRHGEVFSAAERKVGEYVAAHPADAAERTLGQLAQICGVSEPTVVRFCRRLGLTGYRALRTQLQAMQLVRGNVVHRDVSQGDGVAQAARKVIGNAAAALSAAVDALPADALEAAVERLHCADRIVFCGFGASGWVAQDAAHKFFRLGVACSTATDGPTVLQMAALADARTVIIAISHTGRWPELIEAIRLARGAGAGIIALTAAQSPLAQSCHVLLDAGIEEDTGLYTPMTSRLVQLALCDALQVGLALQMGEAAEAALLASKRALLR